MAGKRVSRSYRPESGLQSNTEGRAENAASLTKESVSRVSQMSFCFCLGSGGGHDFSYRTRIPPQRWVLESVGGGRRRSHLLRFEAGFKPRLVRLAGVPVSSEDDAVFSSFQGSLTRQE